MSGSFKKLYYENNEVDLYSFESWKSNPNSLTYENGFTEPWQTVEAIKRRELESKSSFSGTVVVVCKIFLAKHTVRWNEIEVRDMKLVRIIYNV